MTITVVTANIGRGVSADAAHANIHRVARNFAGAFVGFQEIDEADAPDEAALLAARFPSDDGVSQPDLHDTLESLGRHRYAFAGFTGPGGSEQRRSPSRPRGRSSDSPSGRAATASRA